MPGVGDVLGERTMRDPLKAGVESKLSTSQVLVHDRYYIDRWMRTFACVEPSPGVNVRRTASFQPAYFCSRKVLSMRGSNLRSRRHCVAKPSNSGQIPAVRPAR